MAQTGGRFALSDLAGPPVGNPFGALINGTFVRVGAEYAHYCAYRVGCLLNSKADTIAEIGGRIRWNGLLFAPRSTERDLSRF